TGDHWWWCGYYPDGTPLIKVSGQMENVRCIVWRLWAGELPPIHSVYPDCGEWRCIRPDHLVSARRKSFRYWDKSFWSKFSKAEGCWLWRGEIDKDGYGRVKRNKEHPKRLAHRVSWEFHNGPIPEGM